MLKKLFLIFSILVLSGNFVFAKEVAVKVKALSKISTSKSTLQEGDKINLVTANDVYLDSKLYIKKGEPVSGIITSLVNNDFTCQEASIYAENFKVKNIDGKTVKLNGIVYKKGRDHGLFTQYLDQGFVLIRGGEAQILPDKDTFTLYLDESKNKREVKDDL